MYNRKPRLDKEPKSTGSQRKSPPPPPRPAIPGTHHLLERMKSIVERSKIHLKLRGWTGSQIVVHDKELQDLFHRAFELHCPLEDLEIGKEFDKVVLQQLNALKDSDNSLSRKKKSNLVIRK
jgi:hypothetical protein